MGGYGSGRQSQSNLTDNCLIIDVRQWQRENLLVAGHSFDTSWSRAGEPIGNMGVSVASGHLNLSYNCQVNGGDWERLNYPVKLQTTPCHYGGVRYWFTCTTCGKRVAKLYLAGQYFACRHCYHLSYPCQRETKNDRIIRKAETLKARLQWQPGLSMPNGKKPKGMHWKTFRRLHAEHDELVITGLEGRLSKLKEIVRKLGWD